MGHNISRFRFKKSRSEKLELLQMKIKSMERDVKCKNRRKRFVGSMANYCIGLYILFMIIYLMYMDRSLSWKESLSLTAPLLVLPILVIIVRAIISCHYDWALEQNEMRLIQMREEKENILKEVIDTETYKVAKDILDKYGSPEESPNDLEPLLTTVVE